MSDDAALTEIRMGGFPRKSFLLTQYEYWLCNMTKSSPISCLCIALYQLKQRKEKFR